MNNYLLQLLKEVKTIIIPGLGALTLTNEAAGEMMFMNYLKFDDGTLAKHIAEKEGIELNDASNIIAKFVREVQAEIDKGNSYDMYQFGTFRKENGEVIFEQWSAGKPAAPVAEIPSETIQPEAPENEETVDPGIIEFEPEPTPEAEEEKEQESEAITNEISEIVIASEPAAETEEEKRPEVIPVIIPEINEEPEVELTEKGFDTEHALPAVEEKPVEIHETRLPVNGIPEEVKEEPNVAPSPKDVVIEKDRKAHNKDNSPLVGDQKKKKKTSAFTYILWGIVVLILGAGTYVAVNYDTMKQKYPILAELAGEDTLNVTKTKSMLQAEDTLLAENSEPVAPDTAREPEPISESVPANPEPIAKPVTPAVAKPAPKSVPALKPVVSKPLPKPVVTKPAVTSKPASAPKPVMPKPVVSKPRPAANSSLNSITIGSPDPSKPFHVIGGSFASEANAKNFARTLIQKGNKAVIVGEFNGMYRVSMSGFATKAEALNALGSLSSIVPSAWVFKWP